MDRKGLKFYKLTAGKNKNNLDPFTTPTEEGIAHVQADMERTLAAFSQHVADNRGDRLSKDISEIAQGDTWLGADALSLGLVDEILTSEEYLLGRIQDDGALVYRMKKIKEKKKSVHPIIFFSTPQFTERNGFVHLNNKRRKEREIWRRVYDAHSF